MKYHYYLILFYYIISVYYCEEIFNITVSIIENTAVDKLKWNLIDFISNKTFSYQYLQFSLSNPSEYFEIKSIYLKYRLHEFDREFLCKYNDECSLQLQIFTQTSFIILFKLIILDDNDWKPFFKQNYIHLTLRENLPIHYRIQLPIAYDYDSNRYNINYYEFINNTDIIERIFQLEKLQDELQLILLKKLDCELRNNYQLYIIAVDKGGLKSNILHVNVTIGDINEYQPRFTQRLYHTRIPENLPMNNSSILQISANDDDCNDRIIHYSIINNDIPNDIFPFDIDKYTGFIRVKHQLDYETISTYRFRVKASNLDQITSSIAPIIIDILDVNDNKPLTQINILNEYKSTENFMINISENIDLGQVVGTVLIRDMDSVMINHRLTLKILSCLPLTMSCPIKLDSGMGENSTFSPTTYLIRTSRQLDRENNDEKFTIILEARDYGDPSLSSQYRLIVNINDENDCVPKFTQVNYQFRLANSSSIGSFISQVQANDHDYSPNFRSIQYKFLKPNDQDMFNIDPNNGSLFLAKQPSTRMNFHLTVLAIDQHNHSLYDRANIEIALFDETICLPRFNQTIYVFNTSEHTQTPYEIGRVHTDDCMLSPISMSYHLIGENVSTLFPFSLDTHTGIIKVIHELDREIQSFYQFNITLLNSKTEQITQTEVQINILDENDHYPIFDNSYEQYIYISSHYQLNPNIFITHIHARDDDIGSNGFVNYYFKNKDHYTYFHLYSNGSIVLYNLNNIHLPIRLEIYARDEGYPKVLDSKESIVIYICDMHKRNECLSNEVSNRLRRNFYVGSIFIMISVVLFLVIIIICIIWNIFIKKQIRTKGNNESYNCRIEARKNLIVSDSLDVSSPLFNENHRLKSIVV